MRVRAHAKINLSLEIVGVRRDGYHELRTVFQSVALHDTLIVKRARGSFRLTCDDPSCPPDRDNLVWRAAERMWKAAKRRGTLRGVTIHLAKRIPVNAGLGGGSSDAAGAIRALGAVWRVDEQRQRAIGAALGADVPYFFDGGTALGLERGDRLYALPDQPPAWVVLIVPSFGVSTRDAFAWFDASRPRPRGGSTNDLQAAVARHHPEIARLVAALEASGASQAAMTGSGSTVFGLFSRRSAAMAAAAALLRHGRRAPRVIVTHTIDRKTYRRLAATKPIG